MMKRSVLAALTVALLWAAPAMAQQAQAEDVKRQDIRKLIELTGGSKIGMQILTKMLDMFKTMSPEVPEAAWEEMLKEFSPETLVELTVPIYEKHLTHEDIKGLITFYESPLGRKVIAAMPAVMQESMEAGQQWGVEIAQKVQAKLEAQEKLKSPKGE